MQEFGRTIDDSAVDRCDRLVPEADTQDRDLSGTLAHDIHADAGAFGRARSRREQDAVVRASLLNRHLVVAAHVDVDTQLAEVLHQVEDERVVVVDDENARHRVAVRRGAASATWSTR